MAEQEIKQRRIKTLNVLNDSSFNEKKYEVVKRDQCTGEWCDHGRKYFLRGIHNLLGTEGFNFEWDGEAAYEVGMYCIHMWKKKKSRGEQNV